MWIYYHSHVVHKVHARFVSFGVHKPQEGSHSKTYCATSVAILNKSREKQNSFKKIHVKDL